MDTLVRVFLLVLAIGVIAGAALLVLWLAVAAAVLAWRGVGISLRVLGWSAMSQRSETLRRGFVARVARIAPLPQTGRSTRTEIALEGRPPE